MLNRLGGNRRRNRGQAFAQCIGPTNAFFAFNPQVGRFRIGSGVTSELIDNAAIVGLVSTPDITVDPVNGVFVDGVDDLRVIPLDANPLFTGNDVTFIFQFSQVAGSGVRTIFRARNQANTAYAEARIDGSGNLIWDVNGTTTANIAIADLSATNRIAARYDTDGNIAISLNGASEVTATGATVPTNVHTIFLGNNNGTNTLNGFVQDPIRALPLEASTSDTQEASNLTTQFSCGVFPADMRVPLVPPPPVIPPSGGSFNESFDESFDGGS